MDTETKSNEGEHGIEQKRSVVLRLQDSVEVLASVEA
jgi:hypothetical protein